MNLVTILTGYYSLTGHFVTVLGQFLAKPENSPTFSLYLKRKDNAYFDKRAGTSTFPIECVNFTSPYLMD